MVRNLSKPRPLLTVNPLLVSRHGLDIDRQGGSVGPGLNAPRSITWYRSGRMIKDFIRKPSDFRHSRMPDHTDLTEENLDELYRYFLHMKKS